MNDKPGFRSAMMWLHTWAGVTLGALLFTIFWMGTLSVFDQEIDQWMQPETRLSVSDRTLDADEIMTIVRASHPNDELVSLLIRLPRVRRPYIETYAGFKDSGQIIDRIHPMTGESLGESTSHAASGFIYPMHYRLHGMYGLGYWIIAFATLFMMVLLVTGVVIHRKIFADFFTFRAKNKLRRSSLDLHNITGTLFLPFHLLICLSGLAIFAGWYASLSSSIIHSVNESDRTVELFYAADDYAYYQREPSGQSAQMVPISPLVARAEAIWAKRYGEAAKADRIDVSHFGDRNAYIEVRRHFPTYRTEAHRDSVNFDGATGTVLVDFQASAVRKVRAWLEGFHQIQFDHWLIRWCYFIAGLSACVMIATGFVFWVASRTKKNVDCQPFKIRLVEAMSVGSVTGLIIATGAFLVINRLLSAEISWFALPPAELEVRVFFLAWILAFVHAVLRRKRAWAEQCWMIACLCLSAVFLNGLTTGDHFFASVTEGLWSVAGVDIVLLTGTTIAILSAIRLQGGVRTSADTDDIVDVNLPAGTQTGNSE